MIKKLTHLVVFMLFATGLFAQAQRLVLFEEFTGENCGPCASTNPYVQQLIDAYPSEVVWLRYQSPIPSAGSIYYQDVTDDQTRMTYYGVNSAPWGQQDGAMWDSSANILNNYGNQPITWCANLNTGAINPAYLTAESAVTSPFTITVTQSLNAAADSFYATVTVTGAQDYIVSATGKLKLRVAMMENMTFSTPPGSNGETDFPNVVRKMYPSAAGTAMPDTSLNGQVQIFNFSGKIPAYIYDKTKIRFIAFIQDDNNKHVQQAGLSTYSTLAVDAQAVNVDGNYAVCTTPYAPDFSFTNNGTQTLTSAILRFTLDGTQFDTINWSGSLAPGASTTVTVPNLSPAVGPHKLTAIITNPNGLSDVNIRNDSIYFPFAVTSAPAATPLVEGFENATSPGWFVQNPMGTAYTWTRAAYGDSSSHSYKMDFWDASYGAINYLYAPTLDLTGVTQTTLKFSRADAQYDFGANNGGLSQDSLYVEVSTDCGATWTNVYQNGGNDLATVPAAANAYAPASSDWVNAVVDLSVADNNPSVLLRFNSVSGNGNNLYIDNINISGTSSVGIKKVQEVNAMSVFPNPASDVLNIRLQLAQAAEVSFEITNALGQVVMSGPAEIQSAGNNSLTINTSKLQSGFYSVSLITGTERTTKMFGVIH